MSFRVEDRLDGASVKRYRQKEMIMYITEHPGCTQDEVTAWMIAFDGLSDNRVGNYLAELVKYQFVHVETVKLAEGGMVGYGYYVNERAKWFLEKR